jgi:hypothetical protein
MPNTRKVYQPVTNCLPMTEHFSRSFSILLHFELYKSSLKCKAKGPEKKKVINNFYFIFILTPPTFKPHNFVNANSFSTIKNAIFLSVWELAFVLVFSDLFFLSS